METGGGDWAIAQHFNNAQKGEVPHFLAINRRAIPDAGLPRVEVVPPRPLPTRRCR